MRAAIRNPFLIATATVALAACGGTSSNSSNPEPSVIANSSAGTTASTEMPSAASLGILPGQWETKVETLEVSVKDGPPGLAEAMKAGGPTTISSCITPEQAAKGPGAAILEKTGCSFTKNESGGGRIATEMVCNGATGKMTAHSEGTYAPTAYSVVGEVTMASPASMTVKSRTTGRRTGDCAAP